MLVSCAVEPDRSSSAPPAAKVRRSKSNQVVLSTGRAASVMNATRLLSMPVAAPLSSKPLDSLLTYSAATGGAAARVLAAVSSAPTSLSAIARSLLTWVRPALTADEVSPMTFSTSAFLPVLIASAVLAGS